ncbi:N-acetylmuramoyl-L-alanine amidase family protein [Desulfotomaculum nigrificans]|uniref:N-acetylmuramoyl-L-alanine amidase family protein n=1 Tax=Desulfotomaculum nigrificans TaxID=1565 RepID=UPI0001FAEB30|nr:N-acetylmuramoyl-L-alanine amidase [Desulfotomaculum nigrificans]
MPNKLVVLDPGHGGRDSGATGNGLLEKNITLDIAKRVAARLAAYNVNVRLTRDNDTYISLSARANFANHLGADYFLSIHINAGGGTGFESYIYNGPVSPETSRFRSIIHRNIMNFLDDYGVVNRGEKTANFAVLRETGMPAVLIENLFIDTAKDAALLKDPEFINGLSEAITGGIVWALNLTAKPTKPAPTPTPQPTPAPTGPPEKVSSWDPQGEVAKLKEAGFIVDDHPADAPVTWGEFAAVMNRLINVLNIKNNS